MSGDGMRATDDISKFTDLIQIPLEDWVREIATLAAREVVEKHFEQCPLQAQELNGRLRLVETRLAYVIGLGFGAAAVGGILGGIIGAML